MVRLAQRSITVLTMCLVGLGCQDYSKEGKNGAGPEDTLTQAEFVAAYRDLACQNLDDCCTSANLAFDTDRCASAFSAVGQGTDSTMFNPTWGSQCLRDLESPASCSNPYFRGSCGLVYSGMRQIGETCSIDLDCEAPVGGLANCDRLRGVCVGGLRGKLYDGCQQSCEARNGVVSCVWGAASGYTDGNLVVNCFANDGLQCGDAGQCIALGTSGETCTNDSTCARSLYCAYTAGAGGGTCQPRRSIGETCVEYSTPCVIAAFCNLGTCVERKAQGEYCLRNAECLGVCNCGLSGDCASNGICTDPNALVGDLVSALVAATFCIGSSTAQ